MLETIKNIILYIPRKIQDHFEYIRELEKENAELEIQINERDVMFRRIIDVCIVNSYGENTSGIRKIKELASTFSERK